MPIKIRRGTFPVFLVGYLLSTSWGGLLGKVLILYDPPQASPTANTQQTLQTYLHDHQAELSLLPDLSNIRLEHKQSSFLGDHYRFSYLAGSPAIPLSNSLLVVSIRPNGMIYRIYATPPEPLPLLKVEVKKAPLTQPQAYDLAWKD